MPEGLGGPFNLILGSNAIHTCQDIAGTLRHLTDALADGGFLLFFEFLGPQCMLYWGLDQQCWQFKDEREYSLWITLDHWKGLLADAHLEQVNIVRCAFYCHFLPLL